MAPMPALPGGKLGGQAGGVPGSSRGPVLLTDDIEGRCARDSLGMMDSWSDCKILCSRVGTQGRSVSSGPELQRQKPGVFTAP